MCWMGSGLLLAENGVHSQGSGKVLRVLSRTVTGSDSHVKKITGSAPFRWWEEAGRGSRDTRRPLSHSDCVNPMTGEMEGAHFISILWLELRGSPTDDCRGSQSSLVLGGWCGHGRRRAAR